MRRLPATLRGQPRGLSVSAGSRTVHSDALLGVIFEPKVSGNISQVVSKLMTAAVDCANGCLREPRAVERKVSKRDNNIIAAVMRGMEASLSAMLRGSFRSSKFH